MVETSTQDYTFANFYVIVAIKCDLANILVCDYSA